MPNEAEGEAFHAADCDICLSVRDRHFDLARRLSKLMTRTHEACPPMRSRASEPRGLQEFSPQRDAVRAVGAQPSVRCSQSRAIAQPGASSPRRVLSPPELGLGSHGASGIDAVSDGVIARMKGLRIKGLRLRFANRSYAGYTVHLTGRRRSRPPECRVSCCYLGRIPAL